MFPAKRTTRVTQIWDLGFGIADWKKENHPVASRHHSLNFGFGISDCGFEARSITASVSV
jgi:hypothetical protein